jgi:hypothetical protein
LARTRDAITLHGIQKLLLNFANRFNRGSPNIRDEKNPSKYISKKPEYQQGGYGHYFRTAHAQAHTENKCRKVYHQQSKCDYQ